MNINHESGNHLDPEGEDLEIRPEAEFSENRMERLQARVIELLVSDIESVAALVDAESMGDEEEFEIEIELDTLESGDTNIPLKEEELIKLAEILQSQQAQLIYQENNLEYISSRYGVSHTNPNEVILSVKLKFSPEIKEMSGEFVRLRFSNTCHYCKEAGENDSEVVAEETVPISLAGKWKNSKTKKDKSLGKEYRDWDLGERECQKCQDRGKPSKIFLFYREYK